MKNFDQIFWAIIGAVGIWAAVTPGRRLKFSPENRYNKLPLLGLVVLGGVLFFNTR